MPATTTTAHAELDRQVGVLLERGYPATLTEEAAPLRQCLDDVDGAFVLVAPLIAPAAAMELVEREGATGFSVMDDGDLARFAPIASVQIPAGSAYLLTDVDLGAGNRNVTPSDALGRDRARRALAAHDRRGHRARHPAPGGRRQERRVLALRLALRRQARRRAVDQPGAPEARLVLGGQPAYLARIGVVLRGASEKRWRR